MNNYTYNPYFDVYSNYLAHHGVKGMKWGVRRYQFKDGRLTMEGRKHYGYSGHGSKVKDSSGKLTDYGRKYFGYTSNEKVDKPSEGFVIPKGTEIKRLANNYSYGYDVNVFSAFKVDDINEYTGVLGRISITNQLKNYGSVSLKQVSSVAKNDIHIPSKEVAQDTFKELIKENKDGVQKIFDEYIEKNPNKRGKWYKKINESDYKLNDPKKMDYLYKRFNAVLGMGTSSDNFDVIKKYQDKLIKKGYQGIADENDINVSTFKAKAPTILFDTKNMFTESKVRDLTPSEVYNAYNTSIGSKLLRDCFSGSNRKYDYSIDKKHKDINKYKLNSNYTIENLAKDWGENRLTMGEIRRVNSYMDKGLSYEKSVEKVIGTEKGLVRKTVDKVLKKYDL